MKLYSPENKNTFVFAVVPKNAKEGAQPTYQPVSGMDVESCLQTIDKKGSKNAYQHAMGRYDEFGRYCTYCSAVEGVTPGKFVLHPMAEADRKREEFYS